MSTELSFSELSEQVHLINDLILSDYICDNENRGEVETASFDQHLLETKQWFARISCVNKKRYLVRMLDDVCSAWTLSLLLKSIWNCRPKDAVLSISDREIWSSYDQAPIDHNRTVRPKSTLAQVMKNNLMWFICLDPESQAMVLCELLTVSGGPVMWQVLKHAQTIYERYRDEQLKSLQKCLVNNAPKTSGSAGPPLSPDKNRKDSPQPRHTPDLQTAPTPGQAHKELEDNLALWAAMIKSLRDSVKLEEFELNLNDGTKKKLWKVNRPKPEVEETVDFIQLLPSSVGKHILSYLPRASLGDYARVNKYWAYLVDDFRAELAARQKINADFNKLQELMLRHNTSMNIVHLDRTAAPILQELQGIVSAAPKRTEQFNPSERSAHAVPFKHVVNGKAKPFKKTATCLRKLSELTGRLERRGAADENIWIWCRNICKHTRSTRKLNKLSDKAALPFASHLPCPLIKSLEVPDQASLHKDPAIKNYSKPKRNLTNAMMLNTPEITDHKRFILWTKDFCQLYPVIKILSHQAPV